MTTQASRGVLLFRYAELMMAWMQQMPKGALKINESCKAALSAFVAYYYFERDMKRCADDELLLELAVLHKLLRLDAAEY